MLPSKEVLDALEAYVRRMEAGMLVPVYDEFGLSDGVQRRFVLSRLPHDPDLVSWEEGGMSTEKKRRVIAGLELYVQGELHGAGVVLFAARYWTRADSTAALDDPTTNNDDDRRRRG